MKKMKMILLIFPAVLFAQNDFTNGPQYGFFEINIGQHTVSKDSAIFDFSEETLTFDASDLDSLDLSLGMYWQRSNLLAFGLMMQQYKESTQSEDLEYVFEDLSPIIQATELETGWFGFEAVVTPFGAGEFFGNRAWAPKAFVPFLKVGVGITDWAFVQYGDFVDYETETVFNDEYLSEGTTTSMTGTLGFRVKISPRMDLNFSITKIWAEDNLDSSDFSGFGDLDLSSKSASLGLSVKLF